VKPQALPWVAAFEPLWSAPGSVVSQTFAFMAVAEAELEQATRRHPLKRAAVSALFKYLVPDGLLRGKSTELYRAHVQELVERALAGQDVVPPTDAEVLGFLSELSLKAPFGSQPAALMFELVFKRGLMSKYLAPDYEFREPWEGASQELRDELGRRLPSIRKGVA
jgi:hypothetical protein